MERWLKPDDVAIFPTLDAETLGSGGREFQGVDDDEGSRPKRQRARPRLGEQVCKATLYGRRHRAKMKAMKQATADLHADDGRRRRDNVAAGKEIPTI
jgi:hypothetical protein